LQKPNGVISPRVQKVGGDKFGIVCIDPAKHRSEWMMAYYFGNVLIEPQTVKHQAAFFQLAVEQVRQAQQQHGIHLGRFVMCVQAAWSFCPRSVRHVSARHETGFREDSRRFFLSERSGVPLFLTDAMPNAIFLLTGYCP
jgi:hypothetical protein